MIIELEKGVGPTEAYENVEEVVEDQNLTIKAVTTLAVRHRRKQVVPSTWPRDTIQCLCLMKELQMAEINADEPVPAYIQVINVEMFLIVRLDYCRMSILTIKSLNKA